MGPRAKGPGAALPSRHSEHSEEPLYFKILSVSRKRHVLAIKSWSSHLHKGRRPIQYQHGAKPHVHKAKKPQR
jgi:hypothetical protein